MYDFIVNPASCTGKGLKIWEKTIEPELKKKKIPYEVYFSQKAGDVAVLAQEITSDIGNEKKYLIVLGGDGTVNEALQGITFSENLIFGYIPTGSSNDLARDLELPKDPLKVLDQILFHGTVLPMDIGMVTYPHGHRYFAVSCGIGFDAAVCEEAMHSRMKLVLNKIGLGKLTYAGIALKQIIACRSNPCSIETAEGETMHLPRLLFSASMIHEYEGGGFKFCPEADDRDGLLDICTVGKIPKPVVVLALPTAFFGKHYMFKGITWHRSKKVEIRTTYPLYMHTDGEVFTSTDHIIIECMKEKLLFIR